MHRGRPRQGRACVNGTEGIKSHALPHLVSLLLHLRLPRRAQLLLYGWRHRFVVAEVEAVVAAAAGHGLSSVG